MYLKLYANWACVLRWMVFNVTNIAMHLTAFIPECLVPFISVWLGFCIYMKCSEICVCYLLVLIYPWRVHRAGYLMLYPGYLVSSSRFSVDGWQTSLCQKVSCVLINVCTNASNYIKDEFFISILFSPILRHVMTHMQTCITIIFLYLTGYSVTATRKSIEVCHYYDVIM